MEELIVYETPFQANMASLAKARSLIMGLRQTVIGGSGSPDEYAWTKLYRIEEYLKSEQRRLGAEYFSEAKEESNATA